MVFLSKINTDADTERDVFLKKILQKEEEVAQVVELIFLRIYIR